MSRPLRSTPIAGASPLLPAGPPADAATVLSASRFLPLDTLPLTARNPNPGGRVGTRLPTFHADAADRAHAASMPGTIRPASRTPAGLILELIHKPQF
jgi:hypothetical protein